MVEGLGSLVESIEWHDVESGLCCKTVLGMRPGLRWGRWVGGARGRRNWLWWYGSGDEVSCREKGERVMQGGGWSTEEEEEEEK
jgi:hypothetical protein